MNRNGKTSIVFASLLVPISLLVAFAVSVSLRGSNPDGVDITAGLTYLRPILIATYVSAITCFLVSLIAGVRSLRKDEDRSLGKLGLTLLVGAVVLFAINIQLVSRNSEITEQAYKTKIEQIQ